MTENETKVTAEAVYGRELLDEVAALTWGLTARKEDLQDFTARARHAVRARSEAEDRMVDTVELHDDLGPESGFEAFADLASDVGLFDEIFEYRTTGTTLDELGSLPSLSPWSAPGGGLTPARLDALVDTVMGAVGTIVNALHAAAGDAGHSPGHRPAEWGPGLEPCVVCHQPWPCKPISRVLKATQGAKKALLALGVDEEVIDNADMRHRSVR